VAIVIENAFRPANGRSVRLRSRFLLNSFWHQLLTHNQARTEALYETIEKARIDLHGRETWGTFVAQLGKDCPWGEPTQW